MEHHSFLLNILFYLVAAIVMVPLAKRLGMGAVLGYLVAGVVIGPWGFGLINNVEVILSFSEFGVVLLMFLIGLELEPKRLVAAAPAHLRLGRGAGGGGQRGPVRRRDGVWRGLAHGAGRGAWACRCRRPPSCWPPWASAS